MCNFFLPNLDRQLLDSAMQVRQIIQLIAEVLLPKDAGNLRPEDDAQTRERPLSVGSVPR